MNELTFPATHSTKLRILIINVVVYLVLVAGFAFLLRSERWGALNSLAQHGTAVNATVLAIEPENHNTLLYSYEVGGKTYWGRGQIEDANVSSRILHVGDRLQILYDPQNPERSVLGDPARQLASG